MIDRRLFLRGLVLGVSGLLVPDPVRRVWALDRTMLAPRKAINIGFLEGKHVIGDYVGTGWCDADASWDKANVRLVATMANGSTAIWPMAKQVDGSWRTEPLPNSVTIERISCEVL